MCRIKVLFTNGDTMEVDVPEGTTCHAMSEQLSLYTPDKQTGDSRQVAYYTNVASFRQLDVVTNRVYAQKTSSDTTNLSLEA